MKPLRDLILTLDTLAKKRQEEHNEAMKSTVAVETGTFRGGWANFDSRRDIDDGAEYDIRIRRGWN